MTTHQGCALDLPNDALPFAKVRASKLVIASLKEDDSGVDAVLEEVGDCVECLANLIRFLASMGGALGVSVAESYGSDRNGAVRQFEQQLADAVRELPR
jgi:hypothetical protein